MTLDEVAKAETEARLRTEAEEAEATVVEPPQKKARVVSDYKAQYDTAKLELVKTDETIVTVKRKITEQINGPDRRDIIAYREKELKHFQARRTELAGIIAGIEEAWREIALGSDWSANLRECAADLRKLLRDDRWK